MKKIDTGKYKNFRQFYWRYALVRIGLVWALLTAVVMALFRLKDLMNPWLRKDVLIETVLFIIIAGPLFAYSIGKGIWKNAKRG